jgi:cytochrome b
MAVPDAPPQPLVWPWWQRALHAVAALGVIGSLVLYEGGPWHEGLGYAVLVAMTLRLVMGLAGPRHARFSAFVRSPSATWAYLQQWRRGEDPRFVNHNPLGAWMVLVLLLVGLGAAATGWLYTTDRFWGIEWVILLHATLSWLLLPLVVLHVGGVIHASRRHRENLAAAMLHGRKRAAASDEIGLLPPGGR